MEEWEAQRVRDEEHLNMLGIFNFVLAGLALLGTLAFIPHLVILESGFFDRVFERANRRIERPAEQERTGEQNGEEFPAKFDRATAEMLKTGMKFFLVGFMLITLSAAVLSLLSGLGLRGRRWRGLSYVVAVLQCFAMPVGTVLGVFTIVVLGRPSVRDLYFEAAEPRPSYEDEL